jgi:hypothetical protein
VAGPLVDDDRWALSPSVPIPLALVGYRRVGLSATATATLSFRPGELLGPRDGAGVGLVDASMAGAWWSRAPARTAACGRPQPALGGERSEPPLKT